MDLRRKDVMIYWIRLAHIWDQ